VNTPRAMSGANVAELVAGVLLIFFLPGFALTKATFPEWRVRGPAGLRRAIELGTLSFVLSVVLTVLVGYLLLVAAPGGFQAYWSDPVLEFVLTGVTVVAGIVGVLRGAYSRVPPSTPHDTARARDLEEGAWEVTRRLEHLQREERRIVHSLRVSESGGPEEQRLRTRLEQIRSESAELSRAREAEILD
jgi:uncharacterized membrane protein